MLTGQTRLVNVNEGPLSRYAPTAAPGKIAVPRYILRRLLLPALAGAMRQRTCAQCLDACALAAVPAGRVETVAEALQSPSVTERGVIEVLDHPSLGPVSLIRAAHGLAAQEGRLAKAPPLLGEDTRAILTDVLGLDRAGIAALVQAGAVACLDLEV